MSIRLKLRLLSIFTAVGLAVVLIVTILGLNSIEDKHNAALRRTTYISDLLEIKASAMSTIMLDPVGGETRDVFKAAEENIALRGKIARDAIKRDSIKKELDDVLQLWTSYDKKSQDIIARAASDQKAANDQVTALYKTNFKAFQSALEKFVTARSGEAQSASREAEANTQQMFWTIVILLIAIAVLNVGAVVYFSIGLGRKLTAITGELAKLQEGELLTRLPDEKKDELDAVTQSFNSFLERLGGIVKRTSERSTKLAQAAEQLAATSENALQSAQNQSDAAASVAASVEELSTSIDQVSNSASQAEERANYSGELSQSSGAEVHGAVAQMKHIEEVVTAAAQKMESLREQASNISGIISVIKEVADQTNLLALNAAIEAARAGEQGRGFAVVADEVRKLAERTTESTQEITAMINAIQSETQEAASIMTNGNSLVAQGASEVSKAGESMYQVNESSAGVVASVEEIANALKEQRVAGTEIAKNVEKIAHDSDLQRGLASEVAAAVGGLKSLAQELQQEVSVFKV